MGIICQLPSEFHILLFHVISSGLRSTTQCDIKGSSYNETHPGQASEENVFGILP